MPIPRGMDSNPDGDHILLLSRTSSVREKTSAGFLRAAWPRDACDSSGLSDTSGSQIMVLPGGPKDEQVRVSHAAEAAYPVAAMCRALRVSTSGYYDWL